MLNKAVRILKNQGAGALVKKTIRKISRRDLMYEEYRKDNTPSLDELKRQREECDELLKNTAGSVYAPKFSILVPLYNTPVNYLEALVESVLSQTYQNFELCFSDGSGKGNAPELKKYLAELLTREDNILRADNGISVKPDRIRLYTSDEPLDISTNTNKAFSVATGDYIAFMDHDDLLTPDALYEFYKAIKGNPEAEFFYSDEDKTDSKGNQYFEPHFKPDYDPALLCSTNYICHFVAVKRSLYERVGGLNPEYNGAQDYDFVLRCTENTDTEKIVHVKKILYHWRFHNASTAKNVHSKDYAFDAGLKALEAHYGRMLSEDAVAGESGANAGPGNAGNVRVEKTIVPGIYKTTGLDYKSFFNVENVKTITVAENGLITEAGTYDKDSGYEPPYDIKNFKGFDVTEYGYMNRLLCMRMDSEGSLYLPN